jgi:hypothetical protein
MEETVVTVDVSKAARLQRALKWASGTKQVSQSVMCSVHEHILAVTDENILDLDNVNIFL